MSEGGEGSKVAQHEDDLVERATHLSGVDSGVHKHDKEKVHKLKYKEADVNKIMKMGFTKDQAVQALIENNNNLDAAVHTLTD